MTFILRVTTADIIIRAPTILFMFFPLLRDAMVNWSFGIEARDPGEGGPFAEARIVGFTLRMTPTPSDRQFNLVQPNPFLRSRER
jgi:hypothetical protein